MFQHVDLSDNTFDEAIKLANQGIELARASKQTTVEGNLREHLALFRSGKIYTTSQQRVTE